MPKITIDNREVQAESGSTILDAANKLGIKIPTMCYLPGRRPTTSCMVCVVKVEGRQSLLPACGTVAVEGMKVYSDCEEVFGARQAALELLLSDHVGDCMGPCQVACPAHMDIPLMIRQISEQKFSDAIVTIKNDIAMPAVLGRICPAPCENICRRSAFDDAVSICLLKRYVADVDLKSESVYMPRCEPSINKRVAIIGAGPAGLAAAYYLKRKGIDCTIFDDHEKPGGMLRYGISEKDLPRDVLDAEISTILNLGIEFKPSIVLGSDISLSQLRSGYDAVFIAIGRSDIDPVYLAGLKLTTKGLQIDNKTYTTDLLGVFAGGDIVRQRKMTVRSVADGKEAAISIYQFLTGRDVTGPTVLFNSRIGKIKDGEIKNFLTTTAIIPRRIPSDPEQGFDQTQAKKEAGRCLGCDCRKAENCRLRDFSLLYKATQNRYKAERRIFTQNNQHPLIVYEPGKCIDCGICIQIAAEHKEQLGLTFIGRGFNVTVAVPMNKSLANGLREAAIQCAENCPTGALAFKNRTIKT